MTNNTYLHFVDIGTSRTHIAYEDVWNPLSYIWYPGCRYVPLNLFGSVALEHTVNTTKKPLCRLCERRTQPFRGIEAG